MTEFLLSEEELLLKNTVRELADQELAPRAAGYDESGEFPWENVRQIGDLGLFGLTIDEDYGGSGGTSRQLAIVVEEIARGCAATSVIYVAHLSLCSQFINMFGTEGQKNQFLPPLANGQELGAFALTEPGSGSDSGAMRTTATRSNGQYLLSGSKLYITNGTEASTFVVLASHDLSLRTRGIDAFIVERDLPGFEGEPAARQDGYAGLHDQRAGVRRLPRAG